MDALEITEQHNQNSQTDSRFSCGNGQDEENKNLAGKILEEMRKSHKIHVDRKKHKLNGHQQNNQVFPVEEYTNDTNSEKNRAKYQEM